jgi:hypothetical protein
MAIDDAQDIVGELLREPDVNRQACTQCVRAIALLGSAAYVALDRVRIDRIEKARDLLSKTFLRTEEKAPAGTTNNLAMSLCA